MVRDEAPAATIGGVNGKRNVTAGEIGSAWKRRVQILEAVRPASLLRKSILDKSQRSSTAAGRTATFKLCAIRSAIKYRSNSIACSNQLELFCSSRR
jgi:hypothetical protein